MNKLTIPSFDESPDDMFEKCVSGYRDSKKVEKLLRYKRDVERDAGNYLKYIPHDIEHYVTATLSCPDTKMLTDVYTNKFASDKAKTGRAYYNKILAGAGGKCPICSIGVPNTLDHYLPKSEYPTICVFPANLVPECLSCNKNKGDFFQRKNEEMLLHPYFDDLSKIKWLDAKLNFVPQMKAEYYNSYTDDEVIVSRIDLTMKKYKLFGVFAVQANSDICNNVLLWRDQLKSEGAGKLRWFFSKCRESREKEDLNSWASALYRALERQYDEVIDWLNNSE